MGTVATLEQVLAPLSREGELYERLPEGRVRCVACGHRCLIVPGQRGVCKVRWNDGGRLLVPAGYVAGLQLDPVEKKPFFHAYPGARALSFGMLGCDYHCAYCFVGDTPVLTPLGPVSIRSIFEGATDAIAAPDGEARSLHGVEVITGSGHVGPVLKAFRHSYRGAISVVRPMYLPAIRCTPEHRWLATTTPDRGDVREVAACELTPQHFLVVPKPVLPDAAITIDTADLLKNVRVTFSIPCSLSLEEVREIMGASAQGESSRAIANRYDRHPSYIRHVRSKVRRGRWIYSKTQGLLVECDRIRFPNERRPGIPRSLLLDKVVARLLGFYCAEGCIVRSKRRPNSLALSFTFGPDESEARREVRDTLEQLFNVRPQEVRRRTTTAIQVGKSSLALWFAALCGEGAAGKKVPVPVLAADDSVQEAFLETYVAGDGHEYAGGKVTVTTVSRELAYGVAWLALRLGYLPSIYITMLSPEHRIEGRIVRRRPEQYVVVWRRDRTAARRACQRDECFLIPIKSVAIEPFEGDVFNLEVEGEHSYTAGFCAVRNCQNALTSQALRDPMMGVPPEEATPAQIADLALRHRARILTSTYNEPLITSEWAVTIFREGARRGLVGSYVSNGNATPEVLDYLRPWVDLYKVDLKGFDDKRYRKLGGLLSTVLETIRGLHARGFWLEVVTLIVPGFNDSDDELRDLARFLVSVSPDIPWHVTAFRPDYKMTDRGPTTARTLLRAAEIGLTEGLHYVYAGNLPGRVGPFENTWCPACRALLIARVGYTIREDRLTPTGGRCPACATVIAGRWR
jgi:pyruvate formate lyase activating enzyme